MIKATKVLDDFLELYGNITFGEIVQRGKELYEVSSEVKEVINSTSKEFFSAGAFLGEVTRKGFRPSFVLLDKLRDSRNKVVISNEAEWFFLCGRDVFRDNVLEAGGKDIFLVMNTKDEVLGLGKWFTKGKNKMVKPIFDRGDFLRREENRKKRR